MNSDIEVLEPTIDIDLQLDGISLTSNHWTWRDRPNGELNFRRDVCNYVLQQDAPQLQARTKCNNR